MAIRVGRDVLYSPFYRKYNITSQTILETPQNQFIHGNRGCPYVLFGRGSLTVEAAFSGVIFFLALFSLLYLFQVVERYNGAQLQLASASQQYECYGTKKLVFRDEQKRTYMVGWNENKGVCYVNHREEIPYLGSSIFHVSWYQQIKINDYKGRSMVSPGEDKGEYVYLAEHGRVYHRNVQCVYLKPEIREAAYWQLENKRNISGGKYASCRRCGKNVQPIDSMKIYITPYGDSWHISKSCSGLKHNARKVLIEEVGGLPPCSKCGNR